MCFEKNKLFHFLITVTAVIFVLSGCATIKTRTEVSKDYYNLGYLYFSMKKYTEAISAFEKSLEYNSSFKDAKINLIISYQMAGKYEKAEELIISNYKPTLNEFNRNLLLLLGNNYFYNKDYDRALKTFSIYTESYPDNAEGFFNLGMTYQKMNDEENTIKYLLESFKIDGKFIPTVFNLAVYYYDKEDYDSSLVYFRKLVDLDPQNPEVYHKLGLLEYKKEEYAIARDSFTKATDLDPKNPEYYISLARVYAKAYNNRTKTYSYIEKAFVLGYKDVKNIKTMPEFALMNEYTDFKDLLKRYEN